MVRQVQAGRQVGKSGGKIIIIGSVHAEIAPPADVAYNMAKAAVNHLGHTLAVELAPYHINVNTINPGWIDTPGGARDVRRPGRRRRRLSDTLGPAGDARRHRRSGRSFWRADAADYVTGASLRVDGGFVLGLEAPERAADK